MNIDSAISIVKFARHLERIQSTTNGSKVELSLASQRNGMEPAVVALLFNRFNNETEALQKSLNEVNNLTRQHGYSWQQLAQLVDQQETVARLFAGDGCTLKTILLWSGWLDRDAQGPTVLDIRPDSLIDWENTVPAKTKRLSMHELAELPDSSLWASYHAASNTLYWGYRMH